MSRVGRLARAVARRLPPRLRRLVAMAVRSGPAGPAGEPGPDPESDAAFVTDPDLDVAPRLNVLLPHLEARRLTGGPNTAIQLAARLAAAGLPIRFVATHGPLDPDDRELRAHIEAVAGIAVPAERLTFARLVRTGPGAASEADATGNGTRIGRDDVFLATWWRTAWVAAAGLRVTRPPAFLYLVQDFEPAFYPWSTAYAQALETYELPCRAIVNESLLARHLGHEGIRMFGPAADPAAWTSFEPAVDPTVFGPPDAAPAGPPRLLFYARPRNDRNLHDLGIRALRRVAAMGVLDGWECRSIGSPVPPVRLSDRVVLEPQPWLPYRDYGRLLASSDLLVSLMLSPHTSYPPLEMAATGGFVVTNAFGVKTAAALASLSPQIRAARPSIGALAETIAAAVAEAGRPAVRAAPRTRGVQLPASWDAALADVVPWTLAAIEALRSGR